MRTIPTLGANPIAVDLRSLVAIARSTRHKTLGFVVASLLIILSVPVLAQIEGVPPCGIVSLEPTDDWSMNAADDYEYDYTFRLNAGDSKSRCNQWVYHAFWVIPASTAESAPILLFHPIIQRLGFLPVVDGQGVATIEGAFRPINFDMKSAVDEYLQTDASIDLRAMVRSNLGNFTIYEWSNGTHIDHRDTSELFTWWYTIHYDWRENGAYYIDPYRFLMEGTNRLLEYNEHINRVIHAPVPPWSDLDMPAPECDLVGEVYDSCTARNRIISFTDSAGMIKSYSIEVTKSRMDDEVSVELFYRTFSEADAATQSYGDKTVVADDITCDANRIILTDDADHHTHIPPDGVKMACIWVEDNVDREATNSMSSLW